MSVDLILLTNTDTPVWQRSIGAYQVASHCRQQGISCQVIDFVPLFRIPELLEIIDNCIDEHSVAIGVSTTFWSHQGAGEEFFSTKEWADEIVTDDLRNLLVSIKERYPHIKIIAGGAQSYRVEEDPVFDTVFHGYSEQAVAEYVHALKKKAPKQIGRAHV